MKESLYTLNLKMRPSKKVKINGPAKAKAITDKNPRENKALIAFL